jgi:hypothetical protein
MPPPHAPRKPAASRRGEPSEACPQPSPAFPGFAWIRRQRGTETTMQNPTGPKVPTETPDPSAAQRKPEDGASDRPGFDLGGATDPSSKGAAGLPPAGPKGTAAAGSTANGRADGLGDLSGSRPGPAGPAR